MAEAKHEVKLTAFTVIPSEPVPFTHTWLRESNFTKRNGPFTHTVECKRLKADAIVPEEQRIALYDRIIQDYAQDRPLFLCEAVAPNHILFQRFNLQLDSTTDVNSQVFSSILSDVIQTAQACINSIYCMSLQDSKDRMALVMRTDPVVRADGPHVVLDCALVIYWPVIKVNLQTHKKVRARSLCDRARGSLAAAIFAACGWKRRGRKWLTTLFSMAV